MISLVVAMDLGRVIGKDNEMPWYIPEELQYFKEKTMGKAMIMGRKTFESIGRPLKGRLNIVVTRNADYQKDGVTVVHDMESAVKLAQDYADEVMVIGGAEIFDMAMKNHADRLYITVIEKNYEGDTFFPAFEDSYTLTSKSEVNHAQDGTAYTYQIWDKK